MKFKGRHSQIFKDKRFILTFTHVYKYDNIGRIPVKRIDFNGTYDYVGTSKNSTWTLRKISKVTV